MPDGTLILTAPSGHTYVTTPGSALLFPSLCAPTGDLAPQTSAAAERCGERTTMMPLRTRTRAQDRAHRVATERNHNRRARTTPPAEYTTYAGPDPPDTEDPPPF